MRLHNRSQVDAIKKQHPNAKLEFAIVEDIAKKGGFDKAVQGVDYVLHAASPFHMKEVGLASLEPAVRRDEQYAAGCSHRAQAYRGVHYIVLGGYS